MVRAREFRHFAWEKLRGNWGMCALYMLIFTLICGSGAALYIIGIGFIIQLLVLGPMTLGFAILSLNVIRGQKAELEMGFEGFKDFFRSFILALLLAIFTALWSLLFIIPGIVKSYSYGMSYYILRDHPELTANEARKASMALMKGNKWRAFCLDLSFIGWLLLCVLTLGILSFWIMPYREAARAAFYEDLCARSAPRADADTLPPAASETDAEDPAPEAVDMPAAAETDADDPADIPAAGEEEPPKE